MDNLSYRFKLTELKNGGIINFLSNLFEPFEFQMKNKNITKVIEIKINGK